MALGTSTSRLNMVGEDDNVQRVPHVRIEDGIRSTSARASS